MKQLVMVRHATAVDKGGRPDVERRLTDEGHAEAARVGDALARRGIRPDRILSSPANRALSTAVLVAPRLGYALDDIELREAIYDGSDADLLSIVRGLDPAWGCVVVAGHNPTFRSVAAELAALPLSWSFPKGHAAILHLADWSAAQPGKARLDELVPPER